MRWQKFRLKTITSAEDIIISTLSDLGINGAEIEDKVPLSSQDLDRMFVDIMPEGPADDGIAYLDFYLDEDEDSEAMLRKIREELDSWRAFMDLGECSVERSETEDLDWVNNWKKYFHQFYVDDILIIPSWEEVKEEDQNKMIIHIDPGTAFGTGMHETTQLCIRALKKYVVPGSRILDVGTGSGILSIAALKLGAAHAFGTDLDPCAETAVKDNLEANGIQESMMDMLIGNLIDQEDVQNQAGFDCYDIAAANILADVLIPLAPHAAAALKKGGLFITSGILEGKQDSVREAMEKAGLTVLEENHQGEWVSLTARK